MPLLICHLRFVINNYIFTIQDQRSMIKIMKENLKTIISLLIVVVAILGIFDAGFISYEKFAGIVPPCQPGFECEKVLTSPWAYIGPIPLSVYGFFYYIAVLIMASLYFVQYDVKIITNKIAPKSKNQMIEKMKRLTTREWMMALTTFGFFFSLYLVSLMAFIIQGWCLYCLISALSCISLFILNLILWRVEKYEQPV